MTIKIGITGGIGSGKTTLSKHLKKKNFPVHESDQVVDNMYKKPSKKFKKLLISLGLEAAINKKSINKKIISNIIFSNTHIKQKLETFIHKETKNQRAEFIKNHKTKNKKIIFFDVPLLFEKNLDNFFDKIICIISSKKTRLKRVLYSRNVSKKLFNKIINQQTINQERFRRSDYIIYNNKDKKNFISKVDRVISLINIWEKLL